VRCEHGQTGQWRTMPPQWRTMPHQTTRSGIRGEPAPRRGSLAPARCTGDTSTARRCGAFGAMGRRC
jgi:hypothetical protein